ncbi:MAG TPA: hypothetical protein ENK18_04920 [Deltaproteobacteria bacterium]|nr:hypothetical protein [Deltaproteobacteria bacterium]
MILWLLASPASADPVPLTDYPALIAALEAGSPARAVIRYGQCLHDSEPGPGVIQGLPLDSFEIFPKGAIGNPVGFVSTSQTQLIHHPTHGHVHSLTRVKIHEDARVEIMIRYLEPRKLKVVAEEVFGCSLTPSGGLSLSADQASSGP